MPKSYQKVGYIDKKGLFLYGICSINSQEEEMTDFWSKFIERGCVSMLSIDVCTCECHEGKEVKHFAPCCDGKCRFCGNYVYDKKTHELRCENNPQNSMKIYLREPYI